MDAFPSYGYNQGMQGGTGFMTAGSMKRGQYGRGAGHRRIGQGNNTRSGRQQRGIQKEGKTKQNNMQYQPKKQQKSGGDEADSEDASDDEQIGAQVQDFSAYADKAAHNLEQAPQKEVRFDVDEQRDGDRDNQDIRGVMPQESAGTASPIKKKEPDEEGSDTEMNKKNLFNTEGGFDHSATIVTNENSDPNAVIHDSNPQSGPEPPKDDAPMEDVENDQPPPD
jgi:hypothetical protein